MSRSELVIVCIFAAIGMTACIFTLFRIVEWWCDNWDKVQFLYGQYERMSGTLDTIHEIVAAQQDEIKLLKERIDIYEEGNNKSYKGT